MVNDSFALHVERPKHATISIDHGRYTGIGRAQHRQTFFDRPQASAGEMLVGAARNTEPPIVRDVHDPARPRFRADDLTGKDRLVADHRRKAWQAREIERDVFLSHIERATTDEGRDRSE